MGRLFGILIFGLIILWLVVGINNIKNKNQKKEEVVNFEGFETVTKDFVNMQIPLTMQYDSTLSSTAYLQYSDPDNELYFVCYQNQKSENDDLYYTYTNYVKYIVDEILIDGTYSEPIIKTINDLECAQGKVFGSLAGTNDNLELVYHVAIYETYYSYFQLIAWTTKEFENTNKDNMFKIVNSFKYNSNN